MQIRNEKGLSMIELLISMGVFSAFSLTIFLAFTNATAITYKSEMKITSSVMVESINENLNINSTGSTGLIGYPSFSAGTPLFSGVPRMPNYASGNNIKLAIPDFDSTPPGGSIVYYSDYFYYLNYQGTNDKINGMPKDNSSDERYTLNLYSYNGTTPRTYLFDIQEYKEHVYSVIIKKVKPSGGDETLDQYIFRLYKLN